MKVCNLRVNHLIKPIGIDYDKIRITWNVKDCKSQTSFRVTVCHNHKTVYDSGKITSNQTEYKVDYPFKSRTRYTFTVTAWDENGSCSPKVSSYFETTIDRSEWSAQWINPELTPFPGFNIRDKSTYAKPSYLVKEFTLERVRRARLYITSHGYYDAYINGRHIDGYFLAPGISQYNKRLQVQTYDVTKYLHPGKNEIVVSLGGGTYRGSTGWSMGIGMFGYDVGLLCQIENGGSVVEKTDETWRASQNGPLEFEDNMRGERYDGRKTVTGLHTVRIADFGYDNLIGTTLPVTFHERFKAKLITTPNGEKVLDFGQNIAGFVEINICAEDGDTITLYHGETLDKNGNFTQQNFQNPDVPFGDQTIEYICHNGMNTYHQTKCYFGFRYAKIETNLPVTGEEFTAVAVYSDIRQTAFFTCGNQDVNRLFKNTVWSMKSNYVDIPTDCPHREKGGFTGDCQVFSATAVYLMDCHAVLSRYLKELSATQYDDGCVKQVVPDSIVRAEMDGAAGWSDAFEIALLNLVKYYNDDTLLAEIYDSVRRWIDFCIGRARQYKESNKDMPPAYRDYFVDCGTHWGEWCEPGKTPDDYFAEFAVNGHAEEATGYLVIGCQCMSELAKRLGRTGDAQYYSEIARKAANAYRYVYVKDGRIHSDRQCRFVRPLLAGILTDEERKAAADDLVSLIRKNGNRIGTGFLTTHALCNVLADNGYPDVAYDLLLQTEKPSWLYEVRNGATTVWESWSGISENEDPVGSLNHYSFGAVSGFIITKILGINVENGTVTIKPYTDKRLRFAGGKVVSPIGEIRVKWKYSDDAIEYDISVPANCKAALILPDNEKRELSSGDHKHIFYR